jgi:hypothetical protein
MLIKATEKDKDELMEALNKIIPNVYGTGPNYKECSIEIIKPIPSLSEFEENYYKMAIDFCGTHVANHCWFVRLRFQKLLLQAKQHLLGNCI